MAEYRLDKVKDLAEESFDAWKDRTEKDSPYVNEVRENVFSCVSSKKAMKGTELENIEQDPDVKKLLTDKKSYPNGFTFKKVWNDLFASRERALENGFHSNMRQDKFDGSVYDKLRKRLKCARRQPLAVGWCFSHEYPNASSIMKGFHKGDIIRVGGVLSAEVRKTKGKGYDYWHLKDKFGDAGFKFLQSPYGNLIFDSGPKSVVLDGEDLLDSDLGSLNCEVSFVKNKPLCRKMLTGLRQVSLKKSCKKMFRSGYVEELAEKKFNKAIKQKEKEIKVGIVAEENKLKRLRLFVEKLSSPGINNIEKKLKSLSDKHNSFVESGMCSSK